MSSFYINLPIGAATIIAIAFILKIPGQVRPAGGRWTQQLARLDPLGNLLFLPAVVCLLMALQWGGVEHPWNSGAVVAPLVLSVVLFAAFVVVQVRGGENATIPLRVVRRRCVLSASTFGLCLLSSYLGLIYYLPIWFQAIQEASAVQSGLRCLPSMLAVVVFSLVSGGGLRFINHYVPLAVASSVLTTVGAALMTTFSADEASPRWIGYQVVFGAGVGLGVQLGVMAVQTTLETRDIAVGIAIVSFAQYLGGAVCLAVYQGVFNNYLVARLAALLPDLDPDVIKTIGATNIKQVVGPEQYETVREVYHEALTRCWYISVAMAALSIVGSLSMEWGPIMKPNRIDPVEGEGESIPEK